MESARNPFFHRGPIRQRDYFFDRQHELGQALGLLRSLQNVALVGQRRIGKTSILLQLRRRLPESGFVPIYLDLMDRARRPLGTVLAELADSVALELGLDPPEPEHFDHKGRYFRRGFLPAVYGALGADEEARRLVAAPVSGVGVQALMDADCEE